MKKRIIISKNEIGYECITSVKKDNRWNIINSQNDEDKIKQILQKEINNIHLFDNMLIVKTNDDLVVIKNYTQISHDKVFNDFNKKIAKLTINGNLLSQKMIIQKKNNHQKAILGKRALCCATIAGIILISPVFGGKAFIDTNTPLQKNNIISEQNKAIQSVETNKTVSIEEPKIIKKVEKPKLTKEEELFINKVKEYSSMFFIEYDKALNIIKENEAIIKTEYQNQEVGIIRVLAEEFYNNNNIDKSPIVSDISTLEREKLLIKFANVHGITSTDTLATMIAIYRLETGNGTSDACIYKNNFGGLRAMDEESGSYYVMSFKTKEIGAEAFVKTFINIRNISIDSKHYNPNRSLEQNMNRIYCGESSWANKISELKNEVINEYNLQEYMKQSQVKVLIK